MTCHIGSLPGALLLAPERLMCSAYVVLNRFLTPTLIKNPSPQCQLALRASVLKAHGFIAGDFPDIHAWIVNQVQLAVRKGWLNDA
ncbi:hypothetical protein [Shewanella surugensis]|uniref:Uncharacterized protein n=1 Tax=Shewanella surugensis TaxID=212020 RepID=A0ABT0LJ73_9GAMM|nr:hypothetical protein [Shewanella surugensis]MCL1127754.1 hypothetical protein [Shewanella surugensis]